MALQFQLAEAIFDFDSMVVQFKLVADILCANLFVDDLHV